MCRCLREKKSSERPGVRMWRSDQIQTWRNVWREDRFEKEKYHSERDIRVRLGHPSALAQLRSASDQFVFPLG